MQAGEKVACWVGDTNGEMLFGHWLEEFVGVNIE